MTDQPQRKQSSRRRRRQNAKARQAKPVDLWRPVPPLPEVQPITPARDPTALLRSLGEPPPPLPGAAEIAVAQVVDRAAGLATALAAAGGLLAMPEDEPDEDA
ncbi:MAG TPA: hypothetical protein VFW63_07385 [Acidimicrobiales bacterium]|nr:hypothetical protein [Acidimicrobiales bacterium]